MWKLKIAEGGSPWLVTLNNHIGRQVWEFDPEAGTADDQLAVENARADFHNNRFTQRHSADILMRLQRFVGPLTKTIMSLRKELHTMPYEKIDWNEARSLCAKEDLYYPHPLIQDLLWASLHKVVEPLLMHWPGSMLRKRALMTVMKHIHYEDENTRYICIGPVSKVLNMLCCWIEDSNSEAFKRHLPRVLDYLWVAEDGMKMQGYNGSQLWDTAFAVQALISTDLLDECGPMLKKAHMYIAKSQIINPAETFGDIVIDYSYVECTSAVLQALAVFRKYYPDHRPKEIEACISHAVRYIEKIQRSDGSWYGSWGVCFTYGIWFGVLGLVAAGKTYKDCSSIRKACDFLLSKQLPSGGWGAERDPEPLHRAAIVLVNSQMENGDFPQQEIMGVFNRNCMISYSAYRNIFPIWALGEYRCQVLSS